MAVNEGGAGGAGPGAGPGASAPGAAPSADNNAAKAVPTDALDVPPAKSTAAPQRDYGRELAELVARSSDQQPKNESETARAIQERAGLHESAYVQAKQAAIEAAGKGVPVDERLPRQDEALRRHEVEVVPPEVSRKLAEIDAKDFRNLRDPQQQAEAAVTMADAARLNPSYRVALAEKDRDVSEVVQVALDATSRNKDATQPVTKAVEVSGQRVEAAANDPSNHEAANDASRGPTMTLDPAALERVAANRARDVKTAAEQLGLNGIEQVIEQKQARREAEAEEQRAALKKAEANRADQPKGATATAAGNNQVQSDEVFTASKSDAKPIVPQEVEDKYLRVGEKFYHPKNTDVVAFEDKGNKLETRSDSEQIAEAMVTIARARGWDEIKVSGSETFRKEVWLEAAAHGMQVKGYTPSEVDKAELAKRTKDIEANKVEPDSKFRGRENEAEGTKQASESKAREAAPAAADAAEAKGKNIDAKPDAEKSAPMKADDAKVNKTSDAGRSESATTREPKSENQQRAQAFAENPAHEAVKDHPELAGTYAVMASIDKKASADGLDPQQKAIVMERVRANLVNSIERGELPDVKVREQVEVRRERTEEREVTR